MRQRQFAAQFREFLHGDVLAFADGENLILLFVADQRLVRFFHLQAEFFELSGHPFRSLHCGFVFLAEVAFDVGIGVGVDDVRRELWIGGRVFDLHQAAGANQLNIQAGFEAADERDFFGGAEWRGISRVGGPDGKIRAVMQAQRANRLHGQIIALQDAHLRLKEFFIGGHDGEKVAQAGEVGHFAVDFQTAGSLVNGRHAQRGHGDDGHHYHHDRSDHPTVLIKDAQVLACVQRGRERIGLLRGLGDAPRSRFGDERHRPAAALNRILWVQIHLAQITPKIATLVAT